MPHKPTKQKIENIIVRAFGQWTPECRVAAKEIATLIESPGKAMSAMRKTKSGGHAGGRKPDPNAPRCPCGANTLTRAKARNFDCCKKAGLK